MSDGESGKPVSMRGRQASGPLKQLLHLLGSGGLHTMDEIARQMGVSETLVAAMTDNLARQGYLTALEHSCSTACGNCPVSTACGMPQTPLSCSQLLALSAKGRAAAGT
jgi:hypothetical protein